MTDLSMARTVTASARSGFLALVYTAHFAVLYIIVAGITGAIVQTQSGGAGVALLALVALLGAGCLWSASLYQHLFGGGIELGKTASRLSLANALVYMLFGLLGFIASLAVFLLTLVLAVGSGYDMEAEEAGNIDSVTAAFSESGAIWLWYFMIAAIVMVLAWFALRLLVFGAATAKLGAIRIFQTWGWTKGRSHFHLFPSILLIILPFFLLFFLQLPLAKILGEPMGWNPIAVGYGDEIAAASFANIALFWCLSAALATVPIALGHALSVRIYRTVTPQE